MQYIKTTFAHGNGPYSRCVEWAIEVNKVREERGLERLPVVVPLVYPGRQERIMREEVESHVSKDFFENHPDEIWLDRKQGELLEKLMFKGKDYADNLRILARDYQGVEDEMHRHLNGRRVLENFANGQEMEFDLRDCAFQLGLNNRMQTGLPNQFYTAGGAGPFDEVLERAILDDRVGFDEETMKNALPVARRMIEGQRLILSNEPGVFSYDESRILRDNEFLTPGFVHAPKPSDRELPEKGIYFLASGIDGIRESGMYDAVAELGLRVYTAKFSLSALPEELREFAGKPEHLMKPSEINNPMIVAQFARSGWSEVWFSHIAEKGFLTPPHLPTDDPEILFNLRGIERLGLGVVVGDDPRADLKKAIELAKSVGEYNQRLIEEYGTLDGIRFAAEKVVDCLTKDN